MEKQSKNKAIQTLKLPASQRKLKPKKPLVPNEDCGLFISREKGTCYFLIRLNAIEIHDLHTNDWAYWEKRITEIGRQFGCDLIRFWTIRNPVAFHRPTKAKINPLLSGINQDDTYIWCLEKEVKKWAEAEPR